MVPKSARRNRTKKRCVLRDERPFFAVMIAENTKAERYDIKVIQRAVVPTWPIFKNSPKTATKKNVMVI
jgi:hypothetical protein